MIENIEYSSMIITSLYDLDEMVKQFIPWGNQEPKAKRIYFTITNDEGELCIKHISKEEYEKNKEDEGYFNTSLNYNEFDTFFDKEVWENDFYHYLYSFRPPIEDLIAKSFLDTIKTLEEHKAKVLCIDFINKINDSNAFLNDILEDDDWKQNSNEFQKFAASHFLEFNKSLYPNIKRIITNIFPELLKNTVTIESLSQNTNQPYCKNIFRNKEAEDWFYSMLEEFNVSNGERGFGAVIGGIFRNSNCKNHILKSHLKQKEYIQYLNERFNKNMPPTNFSNPDNYSNDIEKFIQLHINSSPE